MKPNPVDHTRTWYNRISRFYDILAWRDEKIPIEAGLRLLDIQHGERVLEIGFGTGHAIISLAESAGAAGTIYGVDIADEMYQVTKRAVERAGFEDRIVLVRADARHLPFDNQFFDAVFMSFTLELFSDTDSTVLLQECRRVIRKEGRLCVVSLAKSESPGIAEQMYDRLHHIFPRYIDCRPIPLSDVLSDNGFIISKKEEFTLHGLPVEIALCRVRNFP
jgi:ubiquinone/menaquinone biosynthesis C-methylase UbiE